VAVHPQALEDVDNVRHVTACHDAEHVPEIFVSKNVANPHNVLQGVPTRCVCVCVCVCRRVDAA
jgi:hypothetical protein